MTAFRDYQIDDK